MLLPEDLFRFALLAVLMGFAAMAALETLEVWRRRTAVVEGRKPRPLSRLERLTLLGGAAGLLAMSAAVAFRAARDREGVLVGRGLQAVRVPPGLELLETAGGPEIAPDAVLARFRKPAALVRVASTDGGGPDEAPGIVEVHATVAGTIAYRAASPESVFGSQPLLVVAPRDGLRARLMLPSREVEPLESTGPVDLELLGRRFVERRFSGHVVEAHPAEGDPSWSVVELAGDPPPDGVRELVSGAAAPDPVVRVELKWSPSVATLPLFRTGLVLALVGGLLFLAARRRRSPEEAT